MRRALWVKVAVAVAAALAIATLPACDDSYKINVDRAVLSPVATNRDVPAAIPIELEYDEFEVPANVGGTLRVEFTSGTRYDRCTLNFDGSYLLEVKQDGGGYYVERLVSGMVPGRRASGSVTCLRPTGLATAFSDSFTIVVRDPGGRITARPLEVFYGDTQMGATAMGQLITLTNLGTSTVSVEFNLNGPGAGSFRVVTSNCRGVPLRPGRQCSVVVGFAPTSLNAVEAALIIRSAPSRPTDSVRLIGKGVPAPVPIASISTNSLAFGTVAVGNSESRRITVKNAGTAPLSLSQLHLEYDQSIIWLFLTSDGCGGRTLAPGETCDFVITFSPQLSGPQSALLRFTSNAAGSPHDIRITGDAVAPAPAPAPTPTPSCDPYHYPYC
ncbi:MAG: choice-of-anchor D domain-containing protein [Actinomycetota bacterium]|nr:choice-of-anchor D domain-containing protein [Actinomycetota bacterium]